MINVVNQRGKNASKLRQRIRRDTVCVVMKCLCVGNASFKNKLVTGTMRPIIFTTDLNV
jgi:hypothetical protein